MTKILATIFFERKYWVGCFERTDKEGYSVARHIFGGEPSDAQVYEFVLHNYTNLKFGNAKTFDLQIRRKNPKRVQREIKREMKKLKATSQPSTLAQDVMREELELTKKEKKKASRVRKERQQQERFTLKQKKLKEKRKGH